METVLDFGQIIIADLILSGDNALIIGMAAAGLSPELRRKAIFYGMVIAALLRILFAIVQSHFEGGRPVTLDEIDPDLLIEGRTGDAPA